MRKFLDTMQKTQIAVGGAFLSIFLVAVVTQMVCRYLGIAAMWTEDVSMYSFIWAVFMGAGAMVHSDAHFAFTSVSEMIKDPRKKIVLELQVDQHPELQPRSDLDLPADLRAYGVDLPDRPYH